MFLRNGSRRSSFWWWFGSFLLSEAHTYQKTQRSTPWHLIKWNENQCLHTYSYYTQMNANVHSRFICHCRIWEQPKSPTTSKWIASYVAPTQGTLLAVRRSSYCFIRQCGKNRRWFCSEKHLDSQGSILYDFM